MEGERYKILLVEDNEIDQMAFKRFVEHNALPYDCIVAGSVSEAQSVLGFEQFDIVISDYSLGDGTAFDILGLVKDIPTIIVTGAGDQEIAVKAWKAGAYDYLVKDSELNYLKALPITVENTIRHKTAEKKLRLLSGAIMSTNDSVYITDMDDKIIFVNKAFCETYVYKEEEIIGKGSNILWIGKQQGANTRSVFQTRTVGDTWEVGFYHKRKDDSIFPISLSRSIIKDPKGNEVAVVGVVRDISEQILIEDELKTANLKLKKRNQMQSETAVMAAEALVTLLDNESTEKAKRVISDFLELSKIDTGKMELKRSEFSFQSLIKQAVQELSHIAAEKNIELKSLMPDRELIVGADYNRISEAIKNLITRAIKTVSAGGHINVQVTDSSSEITVQIQDDGPVIESSEIHKIFNRYNWVKEQLHCRQEELAFGLPIAKELVEMHGGRVWAKSAEGQGNNFCFTLPKSGSRQEAAMATAPASP
ncbi:MAG: ATP-binding protein [Planctomycetota bacterium]|nr:ATP-binding protein [Planctomycetota bacterium]